MRSSILSPPLRAAVLASLALGAASAVSLGQAFTVTAVHPPPGPTTTNNVIGSPTLGGNAFFRISNIAGVVGSPSSPIELETVATATTGGIANTDNYLSRIGQFTFAYDNPILNVRLDLGVNSVYTENFGSQGTVDGTPDGNFSRSGFLLHDFGLLFVGNAGTTFALSRITDPTSARVSADENFAVVEAPGGGLTIEYVDPPDLDINGNLIPKQGQVRSLEWLDAVPDDGNWNPNPGYTIPDPPNPDIVIDPLGNDTFPVAADGATPSTFYMERGINSGGDPLYVTGGNNTVWNVYLFSTGPIGSNLQLNLSQIQVTLAVPEASDALAAGLGLILMAGVIRSRMRA